MDTDETDRLLTFKTGQILAVRSQDSIHRAGFLYRNQLVQSDRMIIWLNELDNYPICSSLHYDIPSLEESLGVNECTINQLEVLINFINLFGDFVHQDARNEHLSTYNESPELRNAWDYFYDFIFFPRLADPLLFDLMERESLPFDWPALHKSVSELREHFEEHIKVISI